MLEQIEMLVAQRAALLVKKEALELAGKNPAFLKVAIGAIHTAIENLKSHDEAHPAEPAPLETPRATE